MVNKPCEAKDVDKSTCVELLYPPLSVSERVDSNNLPQFKVIDSQGGESLLETVSYKVFFYLV